MLSEWNMFVKKIYAEGKASDPNYDFKQALKDASKRKSEMGKTSSKASKSVSSKKRNASMSLAGGKRRRRKTRRNRKH